MRLDGVENIQHDLSEMDWGSFPIGAVASVKTGAFRFLGEDFQPMELRSSSRIAPNLLGNNFVRAVRLFRPKHINR
jgi:hypothetical protein